MTEDNIKMTTWHTWPNPIHIQLWRCVRYFAVR